MYTHNKGTKINVQTLRYYAEINLKIKQNIKISQYNLKIILSSRIKEI